MPQHYNAPQFLGSPQQSMSGPGLGSGPPQGGFLGQGPPPQGSPQGGPDMASMIFLMGYQKGVQDAQQAMVPPGPGSISGAMRPRASGIGGPPRQSQMTSPSFL